MESSKTTRTIGTVSITLAVAAITLIALTYFQAPALHEIPLPFGIGGDSSLAGSITQIGKKNGVTVKKVKYPLGTDVEILETDTLYLVVVPNDDEVPTVPLDEAINLGTTHAVNYFGYKYSSVDATTEKANAASGALLERFPGTFFASAKARAEDAQHGNTIAQFEAANSLTMSATNTATGAMLEKNSLYFLIVNEATPVTLSVRALQQCGDGHLHASESCDDGNTTTGDGCSDVCAVESGYACNGTNPSNCSNIATSTGTNLACLNITPNRVISTDPAFPNKDFASPLFTIKNNGTETIDLANALRLEAREGSGGTFFSFNIQSAYVQGGVTTLASGSQATIDMAQISKYVLDPQETLTKSLSCRAVLRTGFVDSDLTDNFYAGTITFSPIAATCGDGAITARETCDDSNTVAGDGCSAVCAIESQFRCVGEPSSCQSYLDFVKNLADTDDDNVVSENEALILTLDLADAPDQPYNTVSQYDIDNDGDVDNTDVTLILEQLDLLLP